MILLSKLVECNSFNFNPVLEKYPTIIFLQKASLGKHFMISALRCTTFGTKLIKICQVEGGQRLKKIGLEIFPYSYKFPLFLSQNAHCNVVWCISSPGFETMALSPPLMEPTDRIIKKFGLLKKL